MTLQRLIFLLPKIIMKNQDTGISKILKITIFNSILSALFRILFRFNRIFRSYHLLKKKIDLKSLNEFWIVRIGFFRRRNFIPYLNVDPHLLNKPQLCSDLMNLPFKTHTCQEIYVKHFFHYFSVKKFEKVIKKWRKLLIHGGILKIQVECAKHKEKVETLLGILKKNRFYILNLEDTDIRVDNTFTICAVKENFLKNIPPLTPKNEKLRDICSIISQNDDLFFNTTKLCILGAESIRVKNYLKSLKLKNMEIQPVDKLSLLKDVNNGYFDGVIVANFLEFNNYSMYKAIFDELRRILKPNKQILLIVPEKNNYILRETATCFNKGILTQILDKENFSIEWINLNSSFKMLQILLLNQFENPIEKKATKVCLLGNYTLRYTHLNSSWWDGQVRAFEKLGYDLLILDIKDHSFNYLLKSIRLFNPDILWIAGKIVIEFLKENADYFRSSKTTVVYWFWDVRTPIKFDFKGIIDYMFISSVGEIPLYKKFYNLDKIYFMPALITPQILHRNKFIMEEFDIGFTGLLDHSKYHKKRTEIVNYLKEHFQVKIVKNIFNNLPEFYSKCKIVFGGTPDLKNLELYSSNRLYLALSCGCCYITNYFSGLEKLATNEKHLLWYENKKDLLQKIEKYLNSYELRNEIKNNAENLARLKHNYILRINNMLDIINHDTKEFYSFLD